MFNDYLANEEAKQYIERRVQEAEAYRLHKRLGYGDHEAARWVVVLIVLIAAVVLGLLP